MTLRTYCPTIIKSRLSNCGLSNCIRWGQARGGVGHPAGPSGYTGAASQDTLGRTSVSLVHYEEQKIWCVCAGVFCCFTRDMTFAVNVSRKKM